MTPEKMASEARELVDATIWEGIEMERAVAVLKEVPALAARIKSLESDLASVTRNNVMLTEAVREKDELLNEWQNSAYERQRD